jgi:hypothetical protein
MKTRFSQRSLRVRKGYHTVIFIRSITNIWRTRVAKGVVYEKFANKHGWRYKTRINMMGVIMTGTYVTPKATYCNLLSRYTSTVSHHWLQYNVVEMSSEPKLEYTST